MSISELLMFKNHSPKGIHKPNSSDLNLFGTSLNHCSVNSFIDKSQVHPHNSKDTCKHDHLSSIPSVSVNPNANIGQLSKFPELILGNEELPDRQLQPIW